MVFGGLVGAMGAGAQDGDGGGETGTCLFDGNVLIHE